MEQALYRKWRPRTFDDVAGQEQVTRTLKAQVAQGRTSHAYLFIGVRGTGKTTCAKLLARAVNCEGPVDGNPCNHCASCLGIESGGVMDVVEIDAASNNGVDNVRALRDEAVFSPASVKKRVYIIDEVHMLSTSAFNALLKILEEPPEHLMFILATTELHKIPATVMSRCQRYSFRRISPEIIQKRLEFVARQEGIALEPSAAELLSRLADGSLRDGLSLLDQCRGTETVSAQRVLDAMGLAGNFRTAELLGHIAGSDTAAAIELFESLWRNGKPPATVLGELATALRDTMLLAIAPRGGRELLSGGYDEATLKRLGEKVSYRAAMQLLGVLQEHIGALRDGRDPRIQAELCIISLCQPKLLDTPEGLSLRLTRLEDAIKSGAVLPEIVPAATPEAVTTPEPEDAPIPEEPTFDYEESGAAVLDMPPVSIPVPKEPRFSLSASESNPSPEEGDGGLWQRLSAELNRTMPPFIAVRLKGASLRREGEALVISVKSAPAKAALEKPEPQEIIRAGIEKVLGEAALFWLEVAVPTAGGGDLDALARFGNVKFD
ncbi:MAG: DNA polymerase III subunit gamma/tau [Oscillospiraceae bacterium]|nr:DNA polymerase III subunit gamma/tau [Oscillospiraceae bacterium]